MSDAGEASSDASPGKADSASAQDATAQDSGDCPGATKQPTGVAIGTLTSALGAWHLTKTLSNGTPTDVDTCDGTIAYQIGPEAMAPSDAAKTAACALARGEVISFRGGRLGVAECPTVACGPKYGLVWSETSGQVFALDANGKPGGLSLFTLVAVPNSHGTHDLVQSNSGSTVTGNLLEATAGPVNCTP